MAEKDIERKWQEWSSDVLSQLIDLNNRYENLSKELAQKNASLEKELNDKYADLLSKIEKQALITQGNGDPSKGLIIRVDRLEQNETRRGWWIKSIIVGVIGAFATAITAYFKK